MTEKTPLLPLRVYPVELNAFELGLLWATLVKNDISIPKRISKVIEEIYKEGKRR